MDVRLARRVRLRGAGPKRAFVPGGEHGGTGYLLVRPGRVPKVVRGGMPDLPRAAADYFDRPAIAPDEGKRDRVALSAGPRLPLCHRCDRTRPREGPPWQ